MCSTSSKGSESLGNVPKLDNGIMTEIASPILTPTFKSLIGLSLAAGNSRHRAQHQNN